MPARYAWSPVTSGWWRDVRPTRSRALGSPIGSDLTAARPGARRAGRRRKGTAASNRNRHDVRSPVSDIPLAELPEDIATQVDHLGAKQVNLYRCLAHAPDLLRAWIAFAWALRGNSATSRQLRELMILRTATLHHSPYEWHQHRRMAA